LLVAVDYLTKWLIAIPTPSTKAKEVVNFVEKEIVYKFAAPRQILTD